MWAIASVLIVALDIWIIFMQLKWVWLSNNKNNKNNKKEGFGDVQEELRALQKELIIIEEQVTKNTVMAQKCRAVVGAKFAADKKLKAAMQKKLIAARQGKVPKPPWPGVAPPSSMLPVPIQ